MYMECDLFSFGRFLMMDPSFTTCIKYQSELEKLSFQSYYNKTTFHTYTGECAHSVAYHLDL